jgi:tetratricopeptide (TPR) repeat protein
MDRSKEAEQAMRDARTFLKPLADRRIAQSVAGLAVNSNNLGLLCLFTGRPREAEQLLRETLTLRRFLAGKYPDAVNLQDELAGAYKNLGTMYVKTGRPKEALAHYREALDLHQALAAKHPGVPAYQARAAGTRVALGCIYRNTDSRKAEQCFQEALKVYKDLTDHYPTVLQYQECRSTAVTNLGKLYCDGGRFKEAEPFYKDALALWGNLAKKYPSDSHQFDWAVSHSNLGVLYNETRRLKEAERLFLDACQLCKPLAEKHPTVVEYSEKLAGIHYNLGLVYRASGRLKEAEQSFRDAVVAQKTLLVREPRNPEHAIRLGRMQCSLGNLLLDRDRPQDALACYAEAWQTLQPVVARYPRDARVRLALKYFHWGRASILTRLGRHAEALKDLESAHEADDGRSRGWLRVQRALTLARLGDHATAADEAAALARFQGKPAALVYDLARVYALAAAAARDDAALANQYADRAMALLRQVQAAGFFTDPARIEQLRKDPDLGALRTRDDYRKWVANLEKAKTPGP